MSESMTYGPNHWRSSRGTLTRASMPQRTNDEKQLSDRHANRDQVWFDGSIALTLYKQETRAWSDGMKVRAAASDPGADARRQ